MHAADATRALLDFEASVTGPRKDREIRERFGYSPARYYAELSRVLELPEALAWRPELVGRLRRLRDARRALRTARRLRPGSPGRPDPRQRVLPLGGAG